MTKLEPWIEQAIRDHCAEHGPSGGAWNISMILDRLSRATSPANQSDDFQDRVDKWMDACFGDGIKADRLERADRFIEEALELCQTEPSFTADRAHALVDYVFERPVGDAAQEVGGVMITLAALCNTLGLPIVEAAETELARVWTKVEQIRAKQAAKPTGSALPIATVEQPASQSDETLVDYTPDEIEFIQRLMDRYSEGDGIIDLGADHKAFMRIVRPYISRERAAAREEGKREGIEEAAKVAETIPTDWRDGTQPNPLSAYAHACREIAARIRALEEVDQFHQGNHTWGNDK